MQAIKSAAAAMLAMALVVTAFGAGAAAVVWPSSQPAAATLALPVGAASLEAEAAVVLDLKTGQILFEKNAQKPLPLASLTKLMTLQAALSESDLSKAVTITAQDLAQDGDWGLAVGDTLSLRNLIELSLVASSNDAAAAVASTLGPQYLSAMNGAAQDLNLTRSTFDNATGLDLNVEANSAGAYGSAFDVARLTGAFYRSHPELFALTTQPSVTVHIGDKTLSFKATMAPIQDIPGFIGAKTGYTDLAGGNLAAIFDLEPGHPVAAVVLHSSESGRFADMRLLIRALRTAARTQQQ